VSDGGESGVSASKRGKRGFGNDKKKGASTVRRRFGFETARTTASGVTRGVAYLDDGVQELFGLAAGLDDVVAVGVRVVVGVVRAFASVPLRMGVSGQGRTRRSGFGVPEAGRNATNRAKRGGRTCAA
jgi:hypothetical protein